MPESNSISFAIAGCGHIGKRHAEMVQRNPEARLLALADTNSELKAGIEETFSVPFYSSVADMLAANPQADVVTIATPNGCHAAQAIQALQGGHHVVIEKPMGLSKNDCERVIHTALQHSRQVFCVMQNRYSPPSQWLKKVVSSGLLGNIFMVQVNCYWNRDHRYYKAGNWKGTRDMDGGTLFTQFSHFVDIMYWLFGDITNIQARFADFNHHKLTAFEDSGFVNFEFVNGGMGSFNYSTSVWDKNLESSMTIVGQKGTIKVGGQYMEQVEYCHIDGYTMPHLAPTNPANDYGSYKGSAANHHYIIENVVNTLKGKSTITTNALEGLKVVEIIERIYQQKND